MLETTEEDDFFFFLNYLSPILFQTWISIIKWPQHIHATNGGAPSFHHACFVCWEKWDATLTVWFVSELNNHEVIEVW